jgi:hypothetical protein
MKMDQKHDERRSGSEAEEEEEDEDDIGVTGTEHERMKTGEAPLMHCGAVSEI